MTDSSPQADVQKLQELVRKLEEQNDRIRSQQQQQQHHQQLSPTAARFPPPPESPSPKSSTTGAQRHRRISFSDWERELADSAGANSDEQWLLKSATSLPCAPSVLDWLAAGIRELDGCGLSSDGGRQRGGSSSSSGTGGGSGLLAKLNELALIGRLAPSPAAVPSSPLASLVDDLPPASSPSGLSDDRARRDINQPSYRPINSPAGNVGGLSSTAAFDSRTFRRPHARGLSAGAAAAGAATAFGASPGGGGGGGGGYEDFADGGGASGGSQERLHDLTDVQIVAKMQIDALRQQVSRSRSQLSIASSNGSQDDLAAHPQPGLHQSAPESGHQRQRRALPSRPVPQQPQQQHQRPSSAMGQAYRGASPGLQQPQQQVLAQSALPSRPASVTPVVAQQRSSLLPRPNQTGSPAAAAASVAAAANARRASSGQLGLPRPVNHQQQPPPQGRVPSPMRPGARASADHSAANGGGGGFGYRGQR